MADSKNITTGATFGRLTVLDDGVRLVGKGGKYYFCVCDCGTKKLVRGDHLKLGRVKSCGCFNRDRQAALHTKHGQNKRGRTTAIYKIWQGMQNRCFNKNDVAYVNYGGRGITVCDRWRLFEKFYADMGDPPAGKSIDRINNNGNYEPGNCRWATRTEQNRNKRGLVLLTIDGKTASVAEWAESSGLTDAGIRSRIKRGWSHKDAVKTPRLQ